MRVLLLGGTGFIGRAITERCLAEGHQVTLFHRGLSSPGAFPEAEHLIGDRTVDVSALEGRRFDVCFDTSAYEVAVVRASARAIRHPGLNYVFVSSVSVYADLARLAEDGPLQSDAEAEHATLSLERYGALKAACERALAEELDGRVLCVRSGLVVGPHDYDERFRYWLTRIARGGEVLAPGDPEALAQCIDARDLGAWMVHVAGSGRSGPINVTGEPMTMRALLETIRDVLGSDARFRWVPDEVLLAHAVRPYSEMPFWLPASIGARPVPTVVAHASGLSLRPFAETVRDTWQWLQQGWDAESSVRENRRMRVAGGMSPERERAILADA
jgi:2'-hydroxyisoflavone reductase